jgi:MFS family permease
MHRLAAGNLVGLLLSPLLLANYGWRGLFFVFGILGAPLLALWLAVVPDKPASALNGAAALASSALLPALHLGPLPGLGDILCCCCPCRRRCPGWRAHSSSARWQARVGGAAAVQVSHLGHHCGVPSAHVLLPAPAGALGVLCMLCPLRLRRSTL